jgi:hypothetical protein
LGVAFDILACPGLGLGGCEIGTLRARRYIGDFKHRRHGVLEGGIVMECVHWPSIILSISFSFSCICVQLLVAWVYVPRFKSFHEHGHPTNSYSQTFENKSSLPPNPLAGFAAALVCVVVGAGVLVVGAALLHPPKSSSCATCGAPHPGLFGAACDVAAGAAGWLGAEDPQTSLLPQASMLEKPPP